MTQEGNYWLSNRRVTRRGVLRASALGGVGLAGAALIGCGDDDDTPGTTTPGGTAAPGGTQPPTSTEPTPSGDDIKRGGTANLRTTVVFPNLDPHANSSSFATNGHTFFYNGLLQMDPFEEEVPIMDLAENLEVVDPLTLSFSLKEATFHDGAVFTSEDVANSYNRIKNPPEGVLAPRQTQLANIEEIETPDDRTVILHLGSPSASIIPTLAIPDFAILSTADILNDAFDHWDDVNGTGPFMFDTHDRDIRLTRVRNPNYFDAGETGMPYMDGVNHLIIPDDTNAYSAFTTGELDWYLTSGVNAPLLEAMSDITVESKGASSWWSTVVATWKEPFNDERVWQAVALTINKQDVNQVHTEGRGGVSALLPQGGPFALTEEQLLQVPGYKGLGDGQEADMETRRAEAQALLDAAGIPAGTHVELFGWDNAQEWGEMYQDSLERLGFTVNLYIAERAEFVGRLQDHTYGDMAASTRSTAFGDPTPSFRDSYLSASPRNYNDLSIPEVDDLFTQQEQTLDFEPRKELADQMMMKFLEVYPAEVASFNATIMAMHSWVKNFGIVYGNSGFIPNQAKQVWLDK